MSMGGLDPRRSVAENYQMFGREAHGRSPLYEALAASVAGDEEIMGFVGALPRAKQQPNLLFAAARYLLDGSPSLGALRTLVRRHGSDLSAVMRFMRDQIAEEGYNVRLKTFHLSATRHTLGQ